MSDPDSEVERWICVIFGRHPEHFAAVIQITTPLGRDNFLVSVKWDLLHILQVLRYESKPCDYLNSRF